MSFTVDIHSHFYPRLSRAQARLLDPAGPWLKVDGKHGMIMLGEREFRPIGEACWSPAARIEDMDRSGVDVQLMCATPVLFGYQHPAGQAYEWAMRLNDLALELCAYDHRRLKALCQVPLQDIDLACREISRAKREGHLGVQIGNHVGSRDLDDPQLLAFLRHCADEDMAVLVHPWDMQSARMSRYMLQWLVGMPAETHLSILGLILSGAFERLPTSLRLIFAHGGGNFAFQLGRVDNAWRRRDIVRADCPQPPSRYIDRFYVDAAVFSEASLRLLIDTMGAQRILLGSDYPFPLGEQHPGRWIGQADSLSVTEKHLILGDNAQRVFRLERPKTP